VNAACRQPRKPLPTPIQNKCRPPRTTPRPAVGKVACLSRRRPRIPCYSPPTCRNGSRPSRIAPSTRRITRQNQIRTLSFKALDSGCNSGLLFLDGVAKCPHLGSKSGVMKHSEDFQAARLLAPLQPIFDCPRRRISPRRRFFRDIPAKCAPEHSAKFYG
jgi:hypothetical protein